MNDIIVVWIYNPKDMDGSKVSMWKKSADLCVMMHGSTNCYALSCMIKGVCTYEYKTWRRTGPSLLNLKSSFKVFRCGWACHAQAYGSIWNIEKYQKLFSRVCDLHHCGFHLMAAIFQAKKWPIQVALRTSEKSRRQ